MQKITKNIYQIRKEDVYAIGFIVANGTWLKGFFHGLMFEAKVNNIAGDGIQNGRVTLLDVVANYFSKDNAYSSTVARFNDGEWLIRSQDVNLKEMLVDLVAFLEELPPNEVIKPEKQTT